MGELGQKRDVLATVFKTYDDNDSGELTAEQLQRLHGDLRMGGVSLPQVVASIEYVCVADTCDPWELYDVLQELDRRYFLLQDLRWEFSMLDRTESNSITEDQAKWLLQAVHGKYFSQKKWEQFLMQRLIPASGVSFGEIEVMLCDIPNRHDYDLDQKEADREREEPCPSHGTLTAPVERPVATQTPDNHQEPCPSHGTLTPTVERPAHTHTPDKHRVTAAREIAIKAVVEEQPVVTEGQIRKRDPDAKARRQKEIERLVAEEKEAEIRDRELAKQRKEQETPAKPKEKDRKKRQLEEEEKLRQEEADRIRKQLQEEEEAESRRLQELEEQQRREEEERRAEEERLFQNVEQLAEEEARLERKAGDDLESAKQRRQNAADARTKKEAETDEAEAAQRKKDHRHRRIRYDLKVAIKSRDHDKLQHSIKEFTAEKLDDVDSDLARAEKLLREMTAGDYLRRAMTEREISQLEDAMATVKRHGVEAQLAKEMIAANKMLGRLRRLERIRHEILELKQATVAEIRSYQNPPPVVHTVMTATFLLLGHPEKETKNWKAVQALVGKTGKESLKRRCLGCDPGSLDPKATARAKSLLDKHELDEVRDVSAGAATFFIWSVTMMEEAMEVAKQKEEERLNPKPPRETTQSKPQGAVSGGKTSKVAPSNPAKQAPPGNQRRSRSQSTGRNQRSASKTPERNSIQEKMNKVAAARRENDEEKRRKSLTGE